jgi:hypothetical protein
VKRKRLKPRNPIAKVLREGIYRKPRVVDKVVRYKRRPKHPKPVPGESGET